MYPLKKFGFWIILIFGVAGLFFLNSSPLPAAAQGQTGSTPSLTATPSGRFIIFSLTANFLISRCWLSSSGWDGSRYRAFPCRRMDPDYIPRRAGRDGLGLRCQCHSFTGTFPPNCRTAAHGHARTIPHAKPDLCGCIPDRNTAHSSADLHASAAIICSYLSKSCEHFFRPASNRLGDYWAWFDWYFGYSHFFLPASISCIGNLVRNHEFEI